jgi:hypothetical protein
MFRQMKPILCYPIEIHTKQARLLVADKSIAIERSGSALTLTVPSVLDHEVVAIDI